MLVIGAKGFAKEILLELEALEQTADLVFFDDVNVDLQDTLYGKYPIIKSEKQVVEYFQSVDNRFALGIGGTSLREKLSNRFRELGGSLTSVISKFARIGAYSSIGEGVSIMSNVTITNDVIIGEGCLIDRNCTIGHDSSVGHYCHLMPGAIISGRCNIGSYVAMGTGSILFPDIQVGDHAVAGAGAVVNGDVPPKITVIGVPAKPLRSN